MTTPGSGPATPGQQTRHGAAGGAGGERSFGDRAQDETERLRREAKSTAENAGEEMRDQAEHARHGAEELKHEAKQQASRLVEQAKAKVRSTVEEQRSNAAEEIEDVAHALRTGANDLEEHHKDYVARYVNQAADGLERMAEQLRHEEFGALWHHAESFARRQPVLFLGGFFAAGFALARLVKSSADRHDGSSGRYGEHDSSARYGAGDRGRYEERGSSTRSSGVAGTALGPTGGPIPPASATPGSASAGSTESVRPDRG